MRQTSAGGIHSSYISPEGGHVCGVIRGLEQVLSLMVPGHPSSLLLPDRSCPRGGLCPSRGVEQRGWGRIGWLLLRGEQRTLLSSPPPSPKGPWQGHLSGNAPPPSWDGPIFSPNLEELLVPSQETWCQTRSPGVRGPGTGPDRFLEFCVTEVTTAIEQLSLCRGLG